MLNPRFAIFGALMIVLSACGRYGIAPPTGGYDLAVQKDNATDADRNQDVADCNAAFVQSASLIDDMDYFARMNSLADCMRSKGWTVRASCSTPPQGPSVCAGELAKEEQAIAQDYERTGRTASDPLPPLPDSAAPEFPLYDVPADRCHGPCAYWQQHDYDQSRELWSEATTRTKISCSNAGDYVSLKDCLEYWNGVQAQTDQLEQIEHAQPFHY